MSNSKIIVWDIETVPDLKGFAAANGCGGKTDEEVRAAMGDKFPKHIYHSIVCIGALIAQQEEGSDHVYREPDDSAQLAVDVLEDAVKGRAEPVDRDDDRNRNAGGDQPVFDGGRAGLVLGEASEKLHWEYPLAEPRLSYQTVLNSRLKWQLKFKRPPTEAASLLL